MQIGNFFADSKSRAQELSNDVSFVIFGHQTWYLEGGGVKLTPAEIGLNTFSQIKVKISSDLIHQSIPPFIFREFTTFW